MTQESKFTTLADVRAADPVNFDNAIMTAVTKAVDDIGGPAVFAQALHDASRKPWTKEERQAALSD